MRFSQSDGSGVEGPANACGPCCYLFFRKRLKAEESPRDVGTLAFGGWVEGPGVERLWPTVEVEGALYLFGGPSAKELPSQWVSIC